MRISQAYFSGRLLDFPITHTFSDSFFVNVPVAAESLQPLINSRLKLLQFNNTSWISFIASHVTYTKFGPIPVPGRTNGILVRTYVHDEDGNKGIFHFAMDFSDKTYASLANKLYFKSRVHQWLLDPSMALSSCESSHINFTSAGYSMDAVYPCDSSTGTPLNSEAADFFVNSANFWYFQDSSKLYRSSARTDIPTAATVATSKNVNVKISNLDSYPVPIFADSSACSISGACFYLKEFTALLLPHEVI
jgi:hypothetical protein